MKSFVNRALTRRRFESSPTFTLQAKEPSSRGRWGITHHTNGVENVQGIVNLALLRGMIGRKGAGLMPIRGHSNVQGIGSVALHEVKG